MENLLKKDKKITLKVITCIVITFFSYSACDRCQNTNKTFSLTKVYEPEYIDHGYINDVIRFQEKYIAVGGVFVSGNNHSDACIWFSTDGESWQDRMLDMIQNMSIGINALISSEDTIVAVGHYDNLSGGGAVWTSNDGENWTLVNEHLGDNTNTVLNDITYDGEYFYAAGRNSGQGIIFKSSDSTGTSWNEVFRQPITTKHELPQHSEINSVIYVESAAINSGNPLYVAVGFYDDILYSGTFGTHYPSHDAAIWFSDDGINWNLEYKNDPIFAYQQNSSGQNRGSQRLNDVTNFGGGVIYVCGSDSYVSDPAGGDWRPKSFIWYIASIDEGWINITSNPDLQNDTAFPFNHSVKSFVDPNGAFRYGELAIGKEWGEWEWDEYGNLIPDTNTENAIIWRGATGFPRWNRIESDELDGKIYNGVAHTNPDRIILVGSASQKPAVWMAEYVNQE